jgi:hypothetical protein
MKEGAEQAAAVLKKQQPNSDMVVRDIRRANDPIPFRRLAHCRARGVLRLEPICGH